MGVFDYIRCERPLPAPGCDGLEFQTKDTPAQYMDRYEIRADGTLWHENYDIEDQSDPNADGLGRLIGMMAQVNQRWEPCEFTGEIQFYTGVGPQRAWVEFSAYFVKGQLRELHVLQDERAPEASA